MRLQDDQPLWLPKGSVRSLLALILTGSYVAGRLTGAEAISEEVLLLVLGVYFGARGRA